MTLTALLNRAWSAERIAGRLARPVFCLVAIALVAGLAVPPGTGRVAAQAAETATPAPTATPPQWPSCEDIALEALVVALFEETFANVHYGGGRPNEVLLKNCTDGVLKVRGSVQLNRIGGPTVEPVNLAFAYGECTDCQTFAVALQLNLYRPHAGYVSPRNGATALNFRCTRCLTVARALQYSIPVDDSSQLPPRLAGLVREMERQFDLIQKESGSITLMEAEGKINYAIQQFEDLALNLDDQRREAVLDEGQPTPTPIPSPTQTATPTPTPTPSVMATATSAPPDTTGTAASVDETPTPSPTMASGGA